MLLLFSILVHNIYRDSSHNKSADVSYVCVVCGVELEHKTKRQNEENIYTVERISLELLSADDDDDDAIWDDGKFFNVE